MMLSRLLEGFPVHFPAAVTGEALEALRATEIYGLTHDSRRVQPGDLFVALSGDRFDGRAFARSAEQAGAVAILGEVGPGDAGEPEALSVPWLTTADPRALMGPLAARLHDHPDRELTLVGVTGTNGKSTIVAVVAALLEAAGRPAGVLGTLGYRFRTRTFPGERTTPESPDLFAMLRAMRQAGAEAAAMEVSSHGLELHRVEGALFDVAVFTNLTRDHLDFHGDMESYFAAKRRLFDRLMPEGKAVICRDDPAGERLIAELVGRVSMITYGLDDGDLCYSEMQLGHQGSGGVISTPRGAFRFETPLLGRYNLLNILAAVGVGEALGLTHAAMARALAEFRPLTGRLEPVGSGEPVPVLLDFAHTPAALEAALESLRELAGARISLVFGCGGDRDPGKRALMGRIAGDKADRIYATSDNPRSEDPHAILAQIEEGLKASGNLNYVVLPDRREAIRRAIAEAEPGSAVLVAGKGHEEQQIFADRTITFSDRQEVLDALGALAQSDGDAPGEES